MVIQVTCSYQQRPASATERQIKCNVYTVCPQDQSGFVSFAFSSLDLTRTQIHTSHFFIFLMKIFVNHAKLLPQNESIECFAPS